MRAVAISGLRPVCGSLLCYPSEAVFDRRGPGWIHYGREPRSLSRVTASVSASAAPRPLWYGDDRGYPSHPRLCAAIRKELSEHRALLIWDNFETVRSMPARTA